MVCGQNRDGKGVTQTAAHAGSAKAEAHTLAFVIAPETMVAALEKFSAKVDGNCVPHRSPGARDRWHRRLGAEKGSRPGPPAEISPGKNAPLRCTVAGSTPPPLGHESFAVTCPLALVGNAFYPVLVHRPAASIHASSPHSVALMQLRFTSLAVTSL